MRFSSIEGIHSQYINVLLFKHTRLFMYTVTTVIKYIVMITIPCE